MAESDKGLCPSIVIISRDSARTLRACLESTREFADVVLVDTGSSDGSLELARSFAHVRVYQHAFEDFSSSRNLAASYARNDWICPLDTDEWISPELAAALQDFRPASDRHVHAFWRFNWFAGKRLRSKLGREWIRRVYHREHIRFSGAVHECLLLGDDSWPEVARLPGYVGHDPYSDVGHLFQKRWFYARPDLRRTKSAHPAIATLRAFWRFLRAWVFGAGFIDGWRGFVLASADAYGVYLKYIWGYALRREIAERTSDS